MLINLSKLLSGDQEQISEMVTVEMKTFSCRMGEFPVTEAKDFRLDIRKTETDRYLIQGKTEVTLEIPCDRCLEPVQVRVPLEIIREYNSRIKDEDSDEDNFVIGYNLDTEQLLYCEILVNWPMKTLCREDCKGICRKCGANLNRGSCTCDTVELDPRMAKIRDIFNNCK
ncbi:MAG: YceD family protein [Lachnospiraceae bacterium]